MFNTVDHLASLAPTRPTDQQLINKKNLNYAHTIAKEKGIICIVLYKLCLPHNTYIQVHNDIFFLHYEDDGRVNELALTRN